MNEGRKEGLKRISKEEREGGKKGKRHRKGRIEGREESRRNRSK